MRARENPFRTERLERLRYRLPGITWPEILARLRRMEYRAALVGPRGSGKTTLLEELGRSLRAEGFSTRPIRLDEEHRTLDSHAVRSLFDGITRKDVILLDGAEQMNPLRWWRFRRRSCAAGGLIVTTHSAGRMPTLLECRTSPELLEQLIAELLGGSLAPAPMQATGLFEKHRGNLRDALRECYDCVEPCEPLDNRCT